MGDKIKHRQTRLPKKIVGLTSGHSKRIVPMTVERDLRFSPYEGPGARNFDDDIGFWNEG